MKKSQVLAALALAFALGLGVVAPVANTYATVVYPNDATEAQEESLKADVKAANEAYAQLDKVAAYTTLYNDIESDSGLRKALEESADALVDFTADGTYATVDSTDITKAVVNTNIEKLNDLMSYATGNLYARDDKGDFVYINTGRTFNQAQLRTLSKVSDSEDLDTILKAMQTLLDDAKANQTILNDNYKPSADVVTDAKTYVANIIAGIQGWFGTFEGRYNTFNTPSNYAINDLKNVSEDAYKNLVNSQAWKDATKNAYTEDYVRFGLYIKAAEATPKYSQVKALVDAKEDFDKITTNGQAVDYDKALEYIAAFNTAINNYKNGTTTVVTETRTITSADGTVSVTAKLPAGTEIKIVKSDNKVAAFGDSKYNMWDITLVDAKGNTVTFEGNATVSINVPEGIDGAKAGIYFVDAKGNVAKYASTYKDGKLTFTTNHFSLWAVVEDNGKTFTTPESPDTGIIANTEGNASTTVAMVAGLATALTAAGAGVVAYRNARRSTRK